MELLFRKLKEQIKNAIITIGCDNMPSHKIHLSIAKRVNDSLKLDLDSIMLGSVLPDICENKNHSISHY